MSINFNIGKGNKTVVAEDDTEKEEDDNDDESESSNSSNSSGLTKRLLKIVIVVVLFLFLLFVVLYLSSLVNKKTKAYTYEQIEVIMKNAAMSYFNDNPGSLPKN